MNCAENPFKMGIFLQLEVSFKMGAFSDPQHTHPGIFMLESPPWELTAALTYSLYSPDQERDLDGGPQIHC